MEIIDGRNIKEPGIFIPFSEMEKQGVNLFEAALLSKLGELGITPMYVRASLSREPKLLTYDKEHCALGRREWQEFETYMETDQFTPTLKRNVRSKLSAVNRIAARRNSDPEIRHQLYEKPFIYDTDGSPSDCYLGENSDVLIDLDSMYGFLENKAFTEQYSKNDKNKQREYYRAAGPSFRFVVTEFINRAVLSTIDK
jgi:hypothetical protein